MLQGVLSQIQSGQSHSNMHTPSPAPFSHPDMVASGSKNQDEDCHNDKLKAFKQ